MILENEAMMALLRDWQARRGLYRPVPDIQQAGLAGVILDGRDYDEATGTGVLVVWRPLLGIFKEVRLGGTALHAEKLEGEGT